MTDDKSDDVDEGQRSGDKGGGTPNDRRTKEEARTTKRQMTTTTTGTKQHDNQIVHRREGGWGWAVVARRKRRDMRWCWRGVCHRIHSLSVRGLGELFFQLWFFVSVFGCGGK